MSNNVERVVALYDLHVPFSRKISEARDFIDMYRPTTLILGGDFLDFKSLRPIAKCPSGYPISSMEVDEALKELASDYEKANEILDIFDKVVPRNCKKVYIEGNHCLYPSEILKRATQLYKTLDVSYNLSLPKRSYKWIPFNQAYNIEDVYFIHGTYCGLAGHAKKHLQVYRTHIVYGHCHEYQVYCAASPITVQPRISIAVPCLCSNNLEWTKGRPLNWTTGLYSAEITKQYYHPLVHLL